MEGGIDVAMSISSITSILETILKRREMPTNSELKTLVDALKNVKVEDYEIPVELIQAVENDKHPLQWLLSILQNLATVNREYTEKTKLKRKFVSELEKLI